MSIAAAFRSVGDRFWEAAVLHNIGELQHDRGDPAGAVPYFAAAERILVELQSKLAGESSGWLRRLEDALDPPAFAAALQQRV